MVVESLVITLKHVYLLNLDLLIPRVFVGKKSSSARATQGSLTSGPQQSGPGWTDTGQMLEESSFYWYMSTNKSIIMLQFCLFLYTDKYLAYHIVWAIYKL